MNTSGHVVSLETLTTSILRAKRHEGGLKMWPCLEVELGWFAEIREEVMRLVERRVPSDSTRPDHPSNWPGLVGRAAQHSLFNSSGDTSDYTSDFNSQSSGKHFADGESPATGRLVSCFAERLHNFRINTYFPHSGVRPHEEPIVKDNLVCLRFHLPVFTNDRATLILDGERFHFESGIIYFFNKGCIHAAENSGEEPRCHFLFDLWLDEWVFENMFAGESPTTPHPGLRRIDPARTARLCASTPAEVNEYVQGTASGSILRAHRRPDTGVFQKSPVNFDPDIVPTDESIALSDDWHPLEHWGGDTFRWVSRSAGITLLALEDGMESIEVELEPGPGVAELPAQVEIIDYNGCQLLTAHLHGRQTLELNVPVHAGPVNRIRMVARNGGRPVEGDPRVLDFRVFRIDRLRGAGLWRTLSSVPRRDWSRPLCRGPPGVETSLDAARKSACATSAHLCEPH